MTLHPHSNIQHSEEELVWELYQMDDKLTADFTNPANATDLAQMGVKMHSQLRQAKREMDRLTVDESTRNLMRHVTNRLLNEVFSIQGVDPQEALVDPALLPARPTAMPVPPAPTCVDCGSRNIEVR